jgi:hypothetical protein
MISPMTAHKIVMRAGAYRIEATTPTGKSWLLSRVYDTEEAARLRLDRLNAMAAAIMPERGPIEPTPHDSVL